MFFDRGGILRKGIRMDASARAVPERRRRMSRPIDANALKDHVKIFNIGCGCSDDYQKSFLNAIDEQPTIQPVARDINVLSNDLIIRQAAIDQLHQSYNLLDAERRLEDMPFVQLERPKGHWVHRGCGVFECDQCGKLVSTNVYKIEKVSDSFKFCPECGLDMRGDQECSHC